ncbi:LysM peptidoglycan-binding domain-containing protein [Halomonas piscis]|uniref:LysM peptidoglycan-binding domain-containing protein n=1 Tax=Halomonas piscis TaxID=3031727 RepID=A0ABY9YY43_9GAMM|nr:LysM peptidoglycan-binding domain-containing protein [Halomonas piscis]WNK18958.1 LysM peptidoglycan-binding domain-containing protein [Halomonas piscis]
MDQRPLAGQGPLAGRRRAPTLTLILALLLLLAGCAGSPAEDGDAGSAGEWVSIQRGDTLGKLARRAEVPLKRLERFNPGVRARHLEIGQRILIPSRQERAPSGGPYRYRIRQGDTYSGIARHFGTRASRIQAANAEISASALRVGQLIQVPLGDGAAPARPASTASASSATGSAPDLPASAGTWPWPLDDYRVMRPYGKDDRGRLQPMLLAARQGKTARAVAPGEVSFADTMRQLGQVVIVHHDNNLQSVYALCETASVSVGDSVKAGEELCRLADGDDGPVLLFDMRRNGKPLDPGRLLK